MDVNNWLIKKGQRRMSKIGLTNRLWTVKQLAAEYNASAPTNVSKRKTCCPLEQMGYSSKPSVWAPLLSKGNKKAKLQWTKSANWTTDHWKNIDCSDNSRFLLHHANGRVRIWRKQHGSLDPSSQITSLNCWHLSIMADQVHPFMEAVNLMAEGHFQQDNAPSHKDCTVMDWVKVFHASLAFAVPRP